MRNLLYSRIFALSLPLVALVYAVGLLILSGQTASAYSAEDERVTNQAVWDSGFEDNEVWNGFPAATRSHIRQGMYQWDDVNTGADFDVDEGTTEDVYVQSFPWSPSISIPNAPRVTVHYFNNLGKIWYSTLSMNSNWSWDDTSCAVDHDNQTADVRVVSTHESGHLISLDHDSSHTEAVMWPDGTCKLVTVADDHAGVKSIYGTR